MIILDGNYYKNNNNYYCNSYSTPYFTITHFEIYRIILSPFVGNSILLMVMILLSYPSLGTRMENSMGSVLLLLYKLYIILLFYYYNYYYSYYY